MLSLITIILALFFAVGLCLSGEVLRMSLPGLRRFLVPGSVLGGALALGLGPQLASLTAKIGIGEETYNALSDFPTLFINVVFAALMLGRPIDSFGVIWNRARPQIIMGHIYAWGQYVVGLSLTLFLLRPIFDLNVLAGPAIAIGFQGGHGTAAGLDATFESLGFAEGKTIAYALATFGILAGTVFGPFLANYHRTHQPQEEEEEDKVPSGNEVGAGDAESKKNDQPSVKFSPLTGSLTVHLALIGLIILIAYGLLQGASRIEGSLRGGDSDQLFTDYIPLFSVVLIVGFSGQLFLQRLRLDRLINRPTVDSISAFALDMVIFGALATLNLKIVGEAWGAILTLCLGGLAWNLAVYFSLGPRIYPRPWYAFGLGDLGGGTATTASGLLLIRVADPGNRTTGRLAYTEKQPFYEPFMGGGLVTAFALPIVANLGAGISLGITAAVLALWIGFAVRLIRR
jgi:ESS family glutamate:Na+ symporter